MKNNLRLALYVIVFVLSFSLWQRWQTAQQPAPTLDPMLGQVAPTAQSSDVPGVSAASHPTESASDASLIEVQTDVMRLWIKPLGGEIVRVDLLQYPLNKNSEQALSLLQNHNPGRFILQSGLIGEGSPQADALYQSAQKQYRLGEAEALTVPLLWEENGLRVSKLFHFKRGRYDFELEQKIDNQSASNWNGFAYERFVFGQPRASSGLGQVATFTGGVFSTPDDRYQKIDLDEMGKRLQSEVVDSGWVALIQHYFLGAIVPEAQQPRKYFTSAQQGDHFIGASHANANLAQGANHSFKSTIYLGPKIQSDLKALAPDLDKTVDYGMFFLIAQPMFKVLSALHAALGNWGWAIVFMTLMIKALFFMPSAWAYKSMAKMRKLAPEMQRLKERYGEDRQAMSQAMMNLYRKEKVNPMSGCLPMLLQIPFFLAFYWVLVESVELRQAPWFAWVQDLSAMDPYFILPVINAALMYLQQKLNPPPTDPMQAKIMQMLPLIFGIMFMWFPSGLVLYWTVSNAFSIVQQYVMNKRYGGSAS